MGFQGLPGAPGNGEGEILRYERGGNPTILRMVPGPAPRGGEEVRSWGALMAAVTGELAALQGKAARDEGEGGIGSAVLSVQVEILNDPALAEEVEGMRRSGMALAEAVRHAFAAWKARLGAVPDDYLRERVRDLEDLEGRLLARLGGNEREIPRLDRPVILVARDLYPSELLQLDRRWLRGLVLAEGSATSHTVVLAKALRIPTLLGAGEFWERLPEGARMALDGGRGEIAPSDGAPPVERGGGRPGAEHTRARPMGARTADGKRVRLLANLDLPEEVSEARIAGAQGVGLLRTEFLYLAGGAQFSPDEETDIYRRYFQAIPPSRGVVRLLDLGSDKPWPGLPVSREPNPALGERGVRLLLGHPSLLERQLRSLFQGMGTMTDRSLSLLIPMVECVEEVVEVRGIIERIRREFPDIPSPRLGAMIEIPMMALAISTLVGQVEFVSLGTNDLVQYGAARDRLLPGSGSAWLEPGILRILDEAVKGARRAKLPLSVCGELAGTIPGALVLVGLGVRALSMTPARIPAIREGLARIDVRAAAIVTRELLRCATIRFADGARGMARDCLARHLAERGFADESLV